MDLGKMGSSLKIYYNLDGLNVNILNRQVCGIKRLGIVVILLIWWITHYIMVGMGLKYRLVY